MVKSTRAWLFVFLLFLGLGGLPSSARAEEPAPVPAREEQPAAEDGALDATPAPVPARETRPQEPPRSAGELPAAARKEVWRAGAKRPSDVPAAVMIRAALRRNKQPASSADRSVVEITWHAPGSTP